MVIVCAVTLHVLMVKATSAMSLVFIDLLQVLLVASASRLGGKSQTCPHKAQHLLQEHLLQGDIGSLLGARPNMRKPATIYAWISQ